MSQSNTITPVAPVKRNPTYTIYKPNGRGSGGAISFSLNSEKEAVFVEAANQSGERQFDWDRKIIMKWGLSDLGSILAGLQGEMPETKLFHKTDRANSAANLVRRVQDGQPPFYLTISRQDAVTKEVRKICIGLSDSEVTILETALTAGINRILGW